MKRRSTFRRAVTLIAALFKVLMPFFIFYAWIRARKKSVGSSGNWSAASTPRSACWFPCLPIRSRWEVFREFRKFVAIALLVASAMLAADAGQKAGNPGRFKDSLSEGARLYKRNCAVCHGNDAKGGKAPKSALFTTPAPDLTTLAQRHEGKFPDEYVRTVLRSGVKMPDHGTAEMPIWGAIFNATAKSDQAQQLIAKPCARRS